MTTYLTSETGELSEAHLNEIETVAAVLRDSATLTEIEVRQGDALLRVRRAAARPAARTASVPATVLTGNNGAARSAEPISPGAEPAASGVAAFLPVPVETTEEPTTTPVTAGLVGVFHAPRPPLAPGDRVSAGQVIGQIEAMRLMNDVAAPVPGRIAAVHVEEGQPVEYGQALFEIAPATPEGKSS